MPRFRVCRRSSFVWAFSSATFYGCTLAQGLSDAGSVAPTQTVGDRCSAMFAELCSQAINRCALTGFTLSDCIAANLPTCCTGTLCSTTSKVSAPAAAACNQALDLEDCNAIVTNQVPPACQGVLHQP